MPGSNLEYVTSNDAEASYDFSQLLARVEQVGLWYNLHSFIPTWKSWRHCWEGTPSSFLGIFEDGDNFHLLGRNLLKTPSAHYDLHREANGSRMVLCQARTEHARQGSGTEYYPGQSTAVGKLSQEHTDSVTLREWENSRAAKAF